MPRLPCFRATLALLFLGLAGATAARAQIIIMVTATANSTGNGYTAGQTATFTFSVTGADLSADSGDQFFSYTNRWWEETTADTSIFTAISGTGITGTYAQPSANAGDPLTYIQALPTVGGNLTLEAGAEAPGSSIGLVVNGTSVSYIVAGNLDWGQNFPAPSAYTPATAYFTPFTGTQTLNTGSYVDISLVGGPLVRFTANSLTISAIPEPSTAASLLVGLGALGAVSVARRRRAA